MVNALLTYLLHRLAAHAPPHDTTPTPHTQLHHRHDARLTGTFTTPIQYKHSLRHRRTPCACLLLPLSFKISTQDRTARDEQTTPEDTAHATAHPDPKTTTDQRAPALCSLKSQPSGQDSTGDTGGHNTRNSSHAPKNHHCQYARPATAPPHTRRRALLGAALEGRHDVRHTPTDVTQGEQQSRV